MSRTSTQRSPDNVSPATPEPDRPALELVPPASAFTQDPVLAGIVERVCTSTRAGGAALALEENGAVVCCARAGECAPSLGATLDREAGVSGLCLRTGEAVRCDDAASDSRVDSEAAHRLGIRSILAVPLKSQGSTIGLLEVFSASAHAFGAEQESLVQIAAEAIALRREQGSEHGLEEVGAVPSAPTADAPPESSEAVTDKEPKIALSETAFGTVDSSTEGTGWKRRLKAWIGGLGLAGVAAVGLSLNGGIGPKKAPAEPAAPARPTISAQAQWLSRAAQSGEPSAQYELGMRYRTGDGVERNEAEAVRWLKEAARQGNGDAQYELGNAYADGRGVERDPISAYACYVLAGANGNSASQEALKFLNPKLSDAQVAQVRETIGQMYLQGRGTPVDLVAAYSWFALAEYAGNSAAQRQKQELASKLSTKQLAAANQRASVWLRRHGQRPR